MIWKALSSEYRVLKNEGTKNNHIGVPQTLLKLDASYDMCVLELGANHKGEIKTLSDIARPTAAVITNIGPSHLEHFGSLGNVFRAKIEITSSLERRGLLALCGDDAYLSGFKDRRFKVLRFGLNAANDFRATCVVVEKDRISFTLNGVMDFRLNLLGAHNVYNALAAIAVASHFGVKEEAVRDALASYRHSGMRLNLKKRGGLSIIDDTYNSNPLSMASALDALKAYPARARWVVSGDMLELGKRSGFFHKAMGRLLAKSDIEGLFTMGDLSRHTHLEALKRGMNKDSVKHCTSHEEIVRLLKVRTREGDAVLVKGSRGMRMEEVIKKL
jgi:UDP-N-acetylmuramoyl-tripeptide--D-alanyl-D-alanine ligase